MTSAWVAELGAERAGLGRSSTAARVADVLRSHVTQGRLLPGSRLSEEEIGAALGVSRNTLREAFRQLTHERLLVHEFNRGVFVRRLEADDVSDLYAFRRIVECGAIRRGAVLERLTGPPLAAVRRAVDAGEQAAEDDDWTAVGTANMEFHQALADLADSPRATESMSHLLAELRLVFHVMAAPREFHQPYLDDNRRILDFLEAGDHEKAVAALLTYLDAAEAQLLAAL